MNSTPGRVFLMRGFFLSSIMLLLALLLLYCGLNLVERNIFDLMDLEREAAAFTVQRQGSGLLKLTFSGAAVTISMDKFQAVLKNWLEWLSLSGESG
jgi:ABC-type enterochelin transport system permease subunit